MKNYKRYSPPPPLSRYIDCYWSLESDEAVSDEIVQRYLPLGCQELLVNLGSAWQAVEKQIIDLPQFVISGQFTRERSFKTNGEMRIFSISFKPYGWSLLTGYSAAAFSESVTDVMLLKGVIKELPLKLFEAKSWQERISIANRELLKLLGQKNPFLPDIPIEEIIKSLHVSRGSVNVHEMAKDYYFSLSKLERNFKHLVGLTIKQYAKIVRLQQVLKLYPEAGNFTDHIFDLGYFDQAHFSKEFKLFTGSAPLKYFHNPKNVVEYYLLNELDRLDSFWR